MKMHAFRVVPLGAHLLDDVVAWAMTLPLEDRFFLGQNDVRLDQAFIGQRFLRLNFGKARHGHGPGQMSERDIVERIDLEPGRRFGEDTAAIFDRATGFIAIQFNQFGPRARAIEAYLSAADLSMNPSVLRSGFTIAGHYRQDFYDRLRDLAVIKELSVKISLPGATRHDREIGRAMGSVLSAPLPEGAETVTLKIKPGRDRHSSLAPADVASWVSELVEHSGAGLRGGRIVGKLEDRGEDQVIDLIDDQVTAEQSLPPGLGQRMAIEDRWHALERAILAWIANGEVPGPTGQAA